MPRNAWDTISKGIHYEKWNESSVFHKQHKTEASTNESNPL